MMHKMPKIFAALTANESRPVVTGQEADPQESLARHLKGGGVKWQRKLFDVFVLQEKTTVPLTDKAQMLASIQGLNDLIKPGGGQVVLFETWEESARLMADQAKVRAVYDEAGASIGARVIPVGDAFVIAKKKAPSVQLYDPDGKHSSLEGAYLAACVFYSVFYAKSPVGLPGPSEEEAEGDAGPPKKAAGTIAEKDLKMLQESAWAAVHPGG